MCRWAKLLLPREGQGSRGGAAHRPWGWWKENPVLRSPLRGLPAAGSPVVGAEVLGPPEGQWD